MKQSTWESWFLISFIVFMCLFLVGTLPGSVKAFPSFLWFFIPSIINLAACVICGTKNSTL